MYRLVKVIVPRPLPGPFSYLLDDDSELKTGMWVIVPFGKSKIHALVFDGPESFEKLPTDLENIKLKKILEILPIEYAVSKKYIEFLKWISDYYQVYLGEVLATAIPPASLGLRSSKKSKRDNDFDLRGESSLTVLNQDQLKALDEIRLSKNVILLEGVTGSGKTEVYLHRAQEIVKLGGSVLFLVPEIALTTQQQERLSRALGIKVILWHSAVTPAQRRDLGLELAEPGIKVVLGARSAVFAPIQNLKLIVVDEEHDPSYKQEDRLRYQARDVAILRGKFEVAQVILGSATPSYESVFRASQGRYSKSMLPIRAGLSKPPKIEIVDLKEEPRVEGISTFLAERTLKKIKETLDLDQQVIIYINRRGFASYVLCQECGHVWECVDCSVTLTVYRKDQKLKCHYCGWQEPISDDCPKCNGQDVHTMGFGTEGVEADLEKLFPDEKILRLDRSQITSMARLETTLEKFKNRESKILVGTQMLVKGHDFSGVTLVVVLLADSLFSWPDFRATERAYQVLTQIAGRAGRREIEGEVYIQTFNPEHEVILALKDEVKKEELVKHDLELRQELGYPPFGRIARIRIEDKSQKKAYEDFNTIQNQIELHDVEWLGPTEAMILKVKNLYRLDVLLKGKRFENLNKVIQSVRQIANTNKIRLLVDVDPYGVS